MKSRFLLNFFIFTVGFYLKAAGQQIDEYRHTTDSLLQHLDKSGVITGVLYDRVFPFAALNTFNQTQPDTSSR